ncbi:hypothetical protein GPECTOR_21g644 [Gonium pectorale]|uniref:LHC-related protein n=1 Tax=Gonium pectorale TaxID=33097 RepID=A0A150GHU9_GONPE|nr:hypothetical protein GPECTOR_21g644 [Gonium pectorale]|eukprot:KXZ49418.1 hypothetical protein GPECTOR_21g644 [Gonium pectorale]
MATSLCSRSCSAAAGRTAAFSSNRPAVRVARACTVRVQAVKPPAGVTLPPKQPDVPPPKNGFVDYAEKINSRAAMIGFFALLAVEGIFGKGLLELVGITTGNGLGFEL